MLKLIGDKDVMLVGRYKLWEDVIRVYIIPKDSIDSSTGITIMENPSRGWKYEDFRVDEKPFNDTCHTVDIPRYYSPFELWIGKYEKK